MVYKPLMTGLLGSIFLALTLTIDLGHKVAGSQVSMGMRTDIWSPGSRQVVCGLGKSCCWQFRSSLGTPFLS